MLRRSSNSPIRKAFREKPELQAAWDNEIDFHIARNLLLLRKYRDESQTELSAVAGLSQGKIARIENGLENITLKTLKKMVVALRGRFKVSISPVEFAIPFCPDWWVWMNVDGGAAKWVLHKGVIFSDGKTKTAAVSWKASDQPALPSGLESTFEMVIPAGRETYGAEASAETT